MGGREGLAAVVSDRCMPMTSNEVGCREGGGNRVPRRVGNSPAGQSAVTRIAEVAKAAGCGTRKQLGTWIATCNDGIALTTRPQHGHTPRRRLCLQSTPVGSACLCRRAVPPVRRRQSPKNCYTNVYHMHPPLALISFLSCHLTFHRSHSKT